jgi:hypothetical protein
MVLTDNLLRNAYEDTELLKKNDALGDNFSIARDVDFVIKTPDRRTAEIIRFDTVRVLMSPLELAESDLAEFVDAVDSKVE